MQRITANKYALRWSAKPTTPPNNFFFAPFLSPRSDRGGVKEDGAVGQSGVAPPPPAPHLSSYLPINRIRWRLNIEETDCG